MGKIFLFSVYDDYGGIKDSFNRYEFRYCIHCALSTCCAFVSDLFNDMKRDG